MQREKKRQTNLGSFFTKRMRNEPSNTEQTELLNKNKPVVIVLQSLKHPLVSVIWKDWISKSQEENTIEDINVPSDRNAILVESKTSYQYNTKKPKDTLAGARQPKLLKFPLRDLKSGKTKSCNISCYQQFPWLEMLDVEKVAAFSYCCSKFSPKT
ncbi:unnamed protein product [Lepeophtheirus salmonis]|uniref:(salmon louse) hypothetical protein n=1 Tax=Lepeophtheirus salmonis TaxID=72036 RepID=A0A7R8CNL1_LEPSM|nr:unnamed protein product [Lepeophtheirus salmonis]CAF2874181.1 unnamed protein product [Lepeophtheirus salmonis]